MSPARRLATGAAALLLTAGLGACGVPTETHARPVADKDVPFGLLERGPVTSSTTTTTTTVPAGPAGSAP